jgi:hypothetical protein
LPELKIDWIDFELPARLRFQFVLSAMGFYFFGNCPGKRLPDIRKLPVALNPRRSLTGRTQRKNVRNIPKVRFTRVNSIEGVAEKLFG